MLTSPQCSGNVELRYAHIISNYVVVTEMIKPICIITSRNVNGAGLTSVMNWAVADVMNNLVDWMMGCMRSASVSMLDVESEEGNV